MSKIEELAKRVKESNNYPDSPKNDQYSDETGDVEILGTSQKKPKKSKKQNSDDSDTDKSNNNMQEYVNIVLRNLMKS